jgi:hypothetical protein
MCIFFKLSAEARLLGDANQAGFAANFDIPVGVTLRVSDRSGARRTGRCAGAVRSSLTDRYSSAAKSQPIMRHPSSGARSCAVSDCIHCDIHDLLEPELARESADLGAIAAKVTEVLADLVVMADPQDRAALLADVIANLGHIVLEKTEQPQAAGGSEAKPRRH